MPCRVDNYPDYNSTLSEKARSKKLINQGRKIADEATYSADVLREDILNPVVGDKEVIKHFGMVEKIILKNNVWAEKVDSFIPRYVANNEEYKTVQEAKNKNVEIVDKLKIVKELWLKNDLTQKEKTYIEKEQMKHRQEDIDRLVKTFANKYSNAKTKTTKEKWKKLLLTTLAADSKKILEPQLGFDADSY